MCGQPSQRFGWLGQRFGRQSQRCGQPTQRFRWTSQR
jgi:hypothetical protein